MASHTASRVFGGSPLAVLSRLALMSILVGVVLSTVGLDFVNLLRSIELLARQVCAMGFDAVRYLWHYFLLGAAVVVPLWILMRLLAAARR